MAWLKVDERFFMSAVVLKAGAVGGMVYLEGLTYLMRFNTDVLPRIIVDDIYSRMYGTEEVSAAVAGLESVAAFEPTDGGWFINHYWVEDECWIEGPGEWGNAEVVSIARSNASECAHCGATERLEVDHIVPKSRGGYSHPNNLQILCKPCNMKKHSKVPWGSLGGARAAHP